MAELPCYMGRVPDYAVVNGQMLIDLDGFRMVMPIHIFLEGCRRGKEAIAKWQYAELGMDRKVVPFQ